MRDDVYGNEGNGAEGADFSRSMQSSSNTGQLCRVEKLVSPLRCVEGLSGRALFTRGRRVV